jgi:hypothetical protein
VLNAAPALKRRQKRQLPSLYDEAARAALIALWEASDRKRLSPLLPFFCPSWSAMGICRRQSHADEYRCARLRIGMRRSRVPWKKPTGLVF